MERMLKWMGGVFVAIFVIAVLLPQPPREPTDDSGTVEAEEAPRVEAPVPEAEQPAPAPTQPSVEKPQCVAVVHPILVEVLPATHAVHRRFDPNSAVARRLPERMRFTEGWIMAAPTGGLWLTFANPSRTSSGGPTVTLPLNEQARSDSEFGTAASRDAPGFQGVSATDPEARAALQCVSEDLQGRPRP